MEEKIQQMEDMRNSILSQVLDQSARARCKNIIFYIYIFYIIYIIL